MEKIDFLMFNKILMRVPTMVNRELNKRDLVSLIKKMKLMQVQISASMILICMVTIMQNIITIKTVSATNTRILHLKQGYEIQQSAISASSIIPMYRLMYSPIKINSAKAL